MNRIKFKTKTRDEHVESKSSTDEQRKISACNDPIIMTHSASMVHSGRLSTSHEFLLIGIANILFEDHAS